MYTIKKLEWTRNGAEYTAIGLYVDYCILHDYDDSNPSGWWSCSQWIDDEFVDGSDATFDTVEGCKDYAQRHYEGQVSNHLQPISKTLIP